MVGILLLTHGKLGEAVLDVVTMLLGSQEQVRALALNPGDQIDAFREKARELATELDQGDGVLLLVDVAGGSPANIALEMVTSGNRAVVTGVNLPMLLELFIHRKGATLASLVDRVQDWGREGISTLKPEDMGSAAV
ncbi:Phosphotransferase system, mannose-type IIA component [Moorella glycerini]|uniref:PTS system mannose-specific EIIAB component n=1 Tax=Neomoorella stamsii TaxID=1266720 RepID=A0A9X7J4H6_9FIRM|nr:MULTISPECIES: PTS sugar transporter subunit IIA [Moorella]PRR74378.1 PTS system mannose-specific EIIAB component [Moorella stamsii]CEP66785.1 Phosphotransferase system, mannose-type IIA component [Moorella glycerini]